MASMPRASSWKRAIGATRSFVPSASANTKVDRRQHQLRHHYAAATCHPTTRGEPRCSNFINATNQRSRIYYSGWRQNYCTHANNFHLQRQRQSMQTPHEKSQINGLFSSASSSNDNSHENENADENNSEAEEEEEDDEEEDGIKYLTDLSPGLHNRIRTMKARHDEILTLLQDFDSLDTTTNTGGGGGSSGSDAMTALGKELSSLSLINGLCEQASQIHAERVSLLELLNETTQSAMTDDDDTTTKETSQELDDDKEEANELIQEINEELAGLDEQCHSLSHKLLHSLVPLLNPDDLEELTSSDAVIDIRAGTGGDEASYFASELFLAYQAAARGGDENGGGGGKAWDVEILSVSENDLGGVKEASLVISARGGGGGGGGGNFNNFEHQQQQLPQSDEEITHHLLNQLGPYGFFRYESGVHRVQRVPVNDVKMQTSAVSVAILPSLPDNAIAATLPPSELKIDKMRASGAGGQHVNTTESAVRVTHIPTGIVAYIQEERSQHKNKAKALKLVAARVYALRREEAHKDRSATRSALMGGGDRSERIRTYNFPQDRITDHRCKVSVSGVGSWLGGGGMVRHFAPHLYGMERDERVTELEEQEEENERKRQGNDGDSRGGGKRKGGKSKGKRK